MLRHKTKSRILPQKIKENIYHLFQEDHFIDQATFIIRDFLIGTWKMDSVVHLMKLQNKLLLEPFNSLVKQTFDNSSSIIKLDIEEIAPIVKEILAPFLNAKENDLLYESITRKWWDMSSELAESSLIQGFILNQGLKHIPRLIRKHTLNAVRLLTDLNSEDQYALYLTHVRAKMLFLHQVTNRFPNHQTNYTASFSIAALRAFLVLMIPATYIGLTEEVLVYTIVASIVLALVSYTAHIFNTSSIFQRKHSIESTLFTDYFISDKLLKSVETLLKKRTDPEPVAGPVQINSKRICQNQTGKSGYQYNEDATPEKNIYTNAYIELQNAIHKKRRGRRNALAQEVSSLPSAQLITWSVPDEHGKIKTYTYNPLKQNCNVVLLRTDIHYLKPFCRNNYVVRDRTLLQQLIDDPVIRKEFDEILSEATVVSAKAHRGIVRYGESIKGKTLKEGYSHSRLFCVLAPIINIGETVDNKKQTVVKSIHIPTKFTKT